MPTGKPWRATAPILQNTPSARRSCPAWKYASEIALHPGSPQTTGLAKREQQLYPRTKGVLGCGAICLAAATRETRRGMGPEIHASSRDRHTTAAQGVEEPARRAQPEQPLIASLTSQTASMFARSPGALEEEVLLQRLVFPGGSGLYPPARYRLTPLDMPPSAQFRTRLP